MSIKIIVGVDVKKQHKKAERFCSGLRYLNHFYSNSFQGKYDNIIASFPAARLSNIISVEVELFSSAYSKDKFSRDTFRLLCDIERFIFVNLRVSSIGFDATFNDENKSIKTVFYFINFNKMDESQRLVEPSKDQLREIENKTRARVGNSKTISFKQGLGFNVDESVAGKVSVPYSKEMASNISELITLMGEVDYQVAIQRALKGLQKRQAKKLLNVMNNIIDLAGDNSVREIPMPKKHNSDKFESEKGSESMFDCISD